MVELTNIKSVTMGIIIILAAASGVTINELLDESTSGVPGWHYCSLENTLQFCTDLTKYSVTDAKCIMADGKGDICTSNGVREAWKSINDLVNIPKTDPFVEAIQDCNIIFTNTTIKVPEVIIVNETYWIPYPCWDPINQTEVTCYNESTRLVNKTFYVEEVIKTNKTVCTPIGFNINFTQLDKNYEIIGDCCSFFEDSPYEAYKGLPVISCKSKQNGMCNPIIQQSAPDSKIFDEYGMIYVIYERYVSPESVGGYEYVYNYDIKPSKLEVKR